MNRLELQRALHEARNGYLSARKEMKFYENEISFLKECLDELDKPSLYDQMFNWLYNLPRPSVGYFFVQK